MKKRICFVVSSPLTVKAFLNFHIKNLSKYYEIYLVGDFNKNELTEFYSTDIKKIKSIKIYRKINLLYDLIAFAKLWIFFNQQRFNAVHSITPKAGLLSMSASFFANIDYRIHIFTGQVWATEKGIKRLFLKSFDKLIVTFSTHILVDGRGQLDYLVDQKVVKREQVYVLGKGSISGVDTSLFKPNQHNKNCYKKEIGIDENDLVVLFLGRINYDKGIFDLVNAFKLIIREFKNVHLLIVGFDEEKIMERVIGEFPSDVFKYIGPSTSPAKYYQVADIFCLPSHREGFGTSVIEASSSGLPIVCSNIYGLRDAIIDDITGLRHVVKNHIDLYEQLKKLIDDKNFRVYLGNNGRKFVNENFKKEVIAMEWENFYLRLFSK